jgi:hypothetical protein
VSGGPNRFADIFAEEDTLGLLADRRVRAPRSNEDEIIIGQFEAINAFIERNGSFPAN